MVYMFDLAHIVANSPPEKVFLDRPSSDPGPRFMREYVISQKMRDYGFFEPIRGCRNIVVRVVSSVVWDSRMARVLKFLRGHEFFIRKANLQVLAIAAHHKIIRIMFIIFISVKFRSLFSTRTNHYPKK